MTATQAIRIHRTGGPEVLQWEEIDVGPPGPGEATIKHRAIGLNFIDLYFRSGLYPPPALPSGLGFEGAGTVVAVGEGVTHIKAGDRVAYCLGTLGAYAIQRNMPATHLVKLPRGVDFKTAAAMLLKGLTVQYLLRQIYRLQGTETILFHAAAGGVGLIACQWAKALGVKLIGTVGSDEKAALAREYGAWETINYNSENVPERVRALTGGRKVPVVYDGVGKDTWEMSLDCLAPRGLMVSFGNASGPVTGVNLGILSQKGSLFVTRPTLAHYIPNRARLEAAAKELFALVKSKKIKIDIEQRYALKDAAQAHRDLAERRTAGSSVLLP